MSAFTDALTRLSTGAPTGYNNGDYNASTNPYGFSAGGHRINLYAMTADLTLVTDTVIDEIAPITELTDEIAALAAISSAISAVAAIDDEVTALAALTSQITALGAVTSSITALAPRAADIGTLAPRAADIGTLADVQDGTIASNALSTLATNITQIQNVSSNISAVTAVAAALSNVNTVAGIASAVTTVAGISSAVSTVASNSAAVSAAATNIAAIIAAPTEAANAAASADDAAEQAAALRGTSSSSVAIGTGTKTFTTEADKQWAAGDWVTITDDASPTVNWMNGQVTSYGGTTLEVSVAAIGGSGTKTAWHIHIAGVQGPPAAGTGDVVGVGSSVSGNLMGFADTTGKLVEDSGIPKTDVFRKSTDDLDDIAAGTTNKQFTNTEKTKLAGIEGSADVTDAANVGAAISGSSAKTTPVDNDRMAMTDSANSHALVYVLWSQVKATLKTYFDTLYSAVGHTHAFSAITGRVATLESDIHALTGKTTPVDADELALIDSAASNVLKKLTVANLKAAIWTALGGLINGGTGKTTPVGADMIAIADSAASNATKKVTLTNLWAATFAAMGFSPASSSGPASLALAEDTDNGANKVTVTVPAALSGDRSFILPDANVTIASFIASLLNTTTAGAARDTLSSFGVIRVQSFTVSGTYTPHANMLYCIIECVGGGGGGAGTGVAGASTALQGGCGGSGAVSRKFATAAEIGASKAVTIGAGGSPGAAGDNVGGTGGTTSVGTLCVAVGGGPGQTTNTRSPGAGGLASSGTGDLKLNGNSGGPGVNTLNPSNPTAGANSPYGNGGANGFQTAGAAGGLGAGGSGGMSWNGSAATAGGAGGPGLVIITEFCSA